MRNYVFEFYNRFMQRRSNHLFRGILQTPPMPCNPDGRTILYCALNQPNVRAYILAAKSFLRFYSDVALVVQGDGSLLPEAVQEIQEHLPGIVVYDKEDMFAGIAASADEELRALLPSREDYARLTPVRILYLKFMNVVRRLLQGGRRVVVIDSDLVFLRRPDEIIQWIEEPYRHDFYGDGYNAEADRYRKLFSFDSLDVANFSSGTIGVGGEVSDEELKGILRRVHENDPELFAKWEVEQAFWAIVMSRRPDPMNLDRLRDVYVGSGWRSYRDLRDNAVIAHFAGAVRFKNFRYQRLAREIIADLKTRA
ncbi:hypothetical protein CSB20_03205 [bacterium DOLZORAL124_64_63]|nr:MAG: hypothetical protein CSB20_03205 [bacterium DOLZORAL124_64_63]